VRSDRDPLGRLLGYAVLASSGLVFGSWLLIAVAHVRDRFNVGHVTGTWFALARATNEGTLYPPLFDGRAFGGTRYMPLQFVIHAGLARVTGDYLVSGKLLAYASAAALFAVMFVVCRTVGGSSVLAAGLVAAVLSTGVGMLDSTTIRGDTLPVALQLGALYVVTRRTGAGTYRSIVVAGFLCALAFFSKSTALWGPIALVVWLALHDRRRLGLFIASFALCGGALFAAFEVASEGRMTQNVFGLAGAGARLSATQTLSKFVDLGQGSANAVWILAPFAVAAIAAGLIGRRPTPYQIALVSAVAILLPVLADVGTDLNQLIDVAVLTAVVTAEAVRAAAPRGATTFVWPLALTAILWGSLSSYHANVRTDTVTAVRSLLGQDTGYAAPLTRSITPRDRIVSEDPYVAVSHGQDLAILDGFMVLKLARDHPAWETAFIRRIRRHEFTKIVLGERLALESEWFRTFSLGIPIARAIAQSYRLVRVPDDPRPGGRYFVYEPRSR
jgi:hypothetical protein